MKCARLIPLAVLVAVISFGCGKSTPKPATVRPETLQSEDSVARIRWLGKKKIAADSYAVGLMEIWNLFETRVLEGQTLDKLSTAPWRLLGRDVTNAPSALVRPLLDDLVREESYLEIRHATNQPAEMVLAIRLPNERIGLWETNLAAVFESLTAIRPTPRSDAHRGWSLQKHHAPDLLEFTRAGDWTILALGPQHNALLETVRARIQNFQTPFVPRTNFWLEADLDPSGLTNALALDWPLPEYTPKIYLRINGNGTKVVTRGELSFPKPLPIDLEQWNVPTNLISARLSSFTAIRGIRPWLASSLFWRDAQTNTPNQLYTWALPNNLFSSYFAMPSPDASNQVDRISNLVLQNGTNWFGPETLIRFERATKFNGLDWRGPPILAPNFRSLKTSSGDLIAGGLFPIPLTNLPGSIKFAQDLAIRTNLVALEWELTGPRVEQLLFISQFTRLVLRKAQLPTNSAGLYWLKATVVRLGPAGTEVDQTGPSRLSFVRKSDIAFTAAEMHLLADWMESPDFPLGLHTTHIKLPPRPPGFPPPPAQKP